MRNSQNFRRMLSVAGIVATLWVTPVAIQAQSNTEFNEKTQALVEEIMRVSGSDQAGLLVGQRMIQVFSKMWSSSDDPKVFAIIEDEVNAIMAEEIIEKQVFTKLLTPIYAKHLSDEDMEEILEFYKTDLGKKFIEIMPSIAVESIEIGSEWGQSIAPVMLQRVTDRLEAEGLKLR